MKLPRDTSEFDFLVIGDGAIGMATAIEYARRNPRARTAIVAPAGRSRAASSAAGLMLNAFAELEPGQLEDSGGRARFELARDAIRQWPEWLDALATIVGTQAPHIRPGTVVLGDKQDHAMKAIQLALLNEKEPHVNIDPADVPGYSPLSTRRAESAIYLPREGGIPAKEVIALLDQAAEVLGIQRINERVRVLLPSEDGCTLRLENDRIIHGRTVLVAAGAWSSALINSIPELTDCCPRVQFGIGRAYRVHHQDKSVRPRTVLRLPNQPSGGGYHLVPFGNDTAYVGASNHCAPHPENDDERSAFPLGEIADRLRRELRSATIEPILGYRPISTDGLPLLGRTQINSVLVATGTRRDGFTTAPYIAKTLIDDVLDGESRFHHVFKPDRCHTADVVSIA